MNKFNNKARRYDRDNNGKKAFENLRAAISENEKTSAQKKTLPCKSVLCRQQQMSLTIQN